MCPNEMFDWSLEVSNNYWIIQKKYCLAVKTSSKLLRFSNSTWNSARPWWSDRLQNRLVFVFIAMCRIVCSGDVLETRKAWRKRRSTNFLSRLCNEGQDYNSARESIIRLLKSSATFNGSSHYLGGTAAFSSHPVIVFFASSDTTKLICTLRKRQSSTKLMLDLFPDLFQKFVWFDVCGGCRKTSTNHLMHRTMTVVCCYLCYTPGTSR